MSKSLCGFPLPEVTKREVGEKVRLNGALHGLPEGEEVTIEEVIDGGRYYRFRAENGKGGVITGHFFLD